MMRLIVLALCAVAMTAALAQAPEPDLKDPAAVGRAYLQACEKWDFEAASKVSLESLAGTAKRLNEPGVNVEHLVKELLCLPALQHTKYLPGDPAVNGEECRLPVVVTYTAPATLVLRKQPDGTWKVDVQESILSTTGAAASVIFAGADQPERTECLSNLKQLGLAILMYAQDHDEVLPHADKWCDEIYPYMKNAQLFKCPERPDLECGYAFSAALSGMPLAKVDLPAQTIIVFESDQGKKNSSGQPTTAPKPGRHNGGNNTSYVDGHAKWLPDQ